MLKKEKQIVKSGNRYIFKNTSKEIGNKQLKKIHSLGIPPAYDKLWLLSQPKDKVQAICVDSKDRKQYFYDKSFTDNQKNLKYLRMCDFMKKMKKFWKHIKRNSVYFPVNTVSKLPKKFVIANMFKIMKCTNIRVGNKKYTNSTGLTTMKKNNLKISKGNFHLDFIGKSGVHHDIQIKDKDVINFLKRMIKTPNDWLMQYQNEQGQYYRIKSVDMNEYLQSVIGKNFTCKDFRTHYSNVMFLKKIKKMKIEKYTDKELKHNVSKVLNVTASSFGHNKSTSKNSYINENLINLYLTNPDKILNGDMDNILCNIYKIKN